MHINTMAELRQLAPQLAPPEAASFVELRGYYKPGDGGGGLFRWEQDSVAKHDGGTVVRPNGAPPRGRWLRVVSGPISVLWFGARADGTDPKGTRRAIQRAVCSTHNPVLAHTTGTVYFPGRLGDVAEYAIDKPIVLPRVPMFGALHILGDGQRVSQIASMSGPVFVPDPNPDNEALAYWTIEHITLANREGCVFEYHIPEHEEARKRDSSKGNVGRAQLIFEDVLFSTSAGSGVEGLVQIYGGYRCRLRNCVFFGMNGSGTPAQKTTLEARREALTKATERGAPQAELETLALAVAVANEDIESTKKSGVALVLEGSAGTVMESCRNDGVPGAMLRAYRSGELWIANCRCEGGYGRPAWELIETDNATLFNIANEGEREWPALFHLVGCKSIVLCNPQLSTPDGSSNGAYADGIRFERCQQCVVISPMVATSFADDNNNRTARIIRIDAESRNIQVRGLSTNHSFYDTEVVCEGKDCFIEADVMAFAGDKEHGIPPRFRQIGVGRLVASEVRASEGTNAPHIQNHPSGFDLTIGGGDAYEPGKAKGGNTFVQLGKPRGDRGTASMYFSAGDREFLQIWRSTRAQIQSVGGDTLHIEGQAGLGLEGKTVTVGSHESIDLVALGTLTVRHRETTSIVADATGLGFFGAPPHAKPTVAYAGSDAPTLIALLHALADLGLVTVREP